MIQSLARTPRALSDDSAVRRGQGVDQGGQGGEGGDEADPRRDGRVSQTALTTKALSEAQLAGRKTH